MPVFLYQAVQAGGGRLSGEIEALSRQDAFSKLRQQNLQPFHLKIKGAKVEDEDAESGGENGGHNLSRPLSLSLVSLLGSFCSA